MCRRSKIFQNLNIKFCFVRHLSTRWILIPVWFLAFCHPLYDCQLCFLFLLSSSDASIAFTFKYSTVRLDFWFFLFVICLSCMQWWQYLKLGWRFHDNKIDLTHPSPLFALLTVLVYRSRWFWCCSFFVGLRLHSADPFLYSKTTVARTSLGP